MKLAKLNLEKIIEDLDKAKKMLAHRDFCPYFELKKLLKQIKRNKSEQDREKFRLLFSNYYGLNVARLSKKFKVNFFRILFEENDACKVIENRNLNYRGILQCLSKIKCNRNKKGAKKLHFSFVSKLIALHKPSSPIYDSHVRAFFGERQSHLSGQDKNKRIDKFAEFLKEVRRNYGELLKDPRISKIIQELRKSDAQLKNCDRVRLLDFLVWKSGQKS